MTDLLSASQLPVMTLTLRHSKELNFVRAEDTGVVFSRLCGPDLYYAPSLFVTFNPAELTLSGQGRLYHPAPACVGGRALVASAIVDSQLQTSISFREDGEMILEYEGKIHTIRDHECAPQS